MPAGYKTYRFALLSAISFFVVAFLSGQTPDATKDKASQTTPLNARPLATPTSAAPANAQTPDPSKYVGAETCKTCHEKLYEGWEKTPHWKTTLEIKGGPSHQGCEGCHGPGADHVAGGGDESKIFTFKNASTKEINGRCMTCHVGGTQHMNAINSLHTQNNVSCISCHSPHHAKTKEFLLVKAQPELCYSCHLQQKSQFEMPFHHRVNEGLSEVLGLPQPAWHSRRKASARLGDAGCHLLYLPYRQAGTICFRARTSESRRLPSCHMPHGGANAAHAEGEQCQFAMSAVPHQFARQCENGCCAGNAVLPQPANVFQVLHALPQPDSRFEFRPNFFQIEPLMKPHSNNPSATLTVRTESARKRQGSADRLHGFRVRCLAVLLVALSHFRSRHCLKHRPLREKHRASIRETTTSSNRLKRAIEAVRSTETSTPTILS